MKVNYKEILYCYGCTEEDGLRPCMLENEKITLRDYAGNILNTNNKCELPQVYWEYKRSES